MTSADRFHPRTLPGALRISSAILGMLLVLTGSRAAQPDAAQDVPQEAVRLRPGETHERALTAGQTHQYLVQVRRQDFVEIQIEQQGIDVVVDVVDPGGPSATGRDDYFGTSGPLRLSWIASANGDLVLTVRARTEGAPPGRYTIVLKEVRPSTDQDGAQVAAEAVLGEAVTLRKQGGEASLKAAIAKYTEAAELCRKAQDPGRLADALSEIGYAYYLLGDLRAALTGFQSSLPVYREAGDRPGEGTTLNNIAAIHRVLGEPQEALSSYQEGLRIKRDLGDARGQADVLNNLGVLMRDRGTYQGALDLLEQALALRRQAGDRGGEALTLLNIGSVYDGLGEHRPGLEFARQALDLARAAGDQQTEVLALRLAGALHSALEETEQARATLLEALRLAQGRGNRRFHASVLSDLGHVERNRGAWQAALDYHQQALALAQDTGDRRVEAGTLIDIGSAHAALGAWPAAQDAFGRALALQRAYGDREGEAIALHGLARVAEARGDLDEALRQVEEALANVESLRSRLTNISLRAPYLAALPRFYDLHVRVLMALHRARPNNGHDSQALAASERGRARAFVELLNESRVRIDSGADPQLRAQERSLQQTLGAKVERHMRLLSEQHSAAEVTAVAQEIAAVNAELDQVQARTWATAPRYAAFTRPQALTATEIQQLLDPGILLLEFSLGEGRSHAWAVTRTSLRSVELPARAAIEAAAREAHRAVSSRPGSVAGADPNRALADLSRMLLGPLRDDLRSHTRLLIVPDGALFYVPFAALPDPARPTQPLLLHHEIVRLPSASSLAALRDERHRREPAPRLVAVLADPVFDRRDERVEGRTRGEAAATRTSAERDLARAATDAGLGEGVIPRLPLTRREARSIASLVPPGGGKVALDFEASLATATDPMLAQYRFVHFATHGFLNSAHPELSGLVLSLVDREGHETRGFLSAPEVFNLQLGADMVVLSGCRTALGKEMKGEGMVGLTRAFMYAGADRVLASLWKVDDAATADLMGRLYRAMLGSRRLRPAEALRAAQLQLLRGGRWGAPYYWAAFQLDGDPR